MIENLKKLIPERVTLATVAAALAITGCRGSFNDDLLEASKLCVDQAEDFSGDPIVGRWNAPEEDQHKLFSLDGLRDETLFLPHGGIGLGPDFIGDILYSLKPGELPSRSLSGTQFIILANSRVVSPLEIFYGNFDTSNNEDGVSQYVPEDVAVISFVGWQLPEGEYLSDVDSVELATVDQLEEAEKCELLGPVYTYDLTGDREVVSSNTGFSK